MLGDIVCGGFGEPLRVSYANRILIVSSEEYMPLYAANNILRGIVNYQKTTGSRFVGLPRGARFGVCLEASLALLLWLNAVTNTWA